MKLDRRQAKETVRSHIEDYLQSKGINTRRAFNCLNPEHNDTTPSMSLDRRNLRVHCFSCGARYDIFDLIALDYGLTDHKEIFDKGYELYGIEVENTPRRSTPEEDFSEMDGQKQAKTGQVYTQPTHTHTQDIHTSAPEEDRTAYYKACRERLSQTDYPASRGLSAETLERHYIGYDPSFRTKDHEENYVQWQALIIPTGRGSYAARNTDPSAHHKDRYRKRGTAQIFGYKSLYSSASPIFITEGEIDAMSIEEAGGSAVGLGSYDNVDILLRLLSDKRPSQMLVIAFDNEEDENKRKRAEEAEEKLSAGLRERGIPFTVYHPYGAAKDANEALVSDREAFSAAIKKAEAMADKVEEEQRERYLNDNAGSYLQQFIDGITASVDTEAIPTGFSTLDAVLDGGLYEGLVTVGGISSLGKTSLIMQVADNVASAGRDVLIFSLEMARSELMAKSISRHTAQIALSQGMDTRNAKTARGITAGKRYANYNRTELQLIQDAITAYGKYAQHLYIFEGVGDITVEAIRDKVRQHLLYTGGKALTDENTGKESIVGGRRPLVIVDYLQIISPYNDRATDKQNTDKAVLELKRISRDYKLPVVAISSFNRSGYKDSVTFEQLKESGSIEYSSDVVIGLQLKGAGKKTFDPTAEKKKNPRDIELVILKNRQGSVGDKVALSYFPMFNYFTDGGLSKD